MNKDEIEIMEDNINSVCDEIKELLIEKNKMYGNSFFKTLHEYGYILICVRLEDKLNRLKQIILKGIKDDKTDERLIDTITDLAGYAILSKIFVECHY